MTKSVNQKKSTIIGIKECLKAVQSGTVKLAFVARDADIEVVKDFLRICEEKSIKIEYVESKKELGKLNGIYVSAAVVCITE